jgi:hypothetical protein
MSHDAESLEAVWHLCTAVKLLLYRDVMIERLGLDSYLPTFERLILSNFMQCLISISLILTIPFSCFW